MMRALVTAAAIGAAALLTLGAACGAVATINRAAESRADQCVAQYGLEICADLAPSAKEVQP